MDLSAISFDSGGRLRVGQLTTLGDMKTLGADEALLMENTGNGTGTWANNKYTMSVTAGQYYIRRSRQHYHYFSGKVTQVECTFDGFQPEVGVTKAIGYFSSSAVAPYTASQDGFYLYNDGYEVWLKAYRAGVETLSVRQSQWNGDPQVKNINWSLFTVVMFDFLWLGGANLRLFIKTPQGFLLAHQFSHAGFASDTFVLSPNQCVRAEIRSTTGSGSFRWICAQVSTEGSINESGKQRALDTTHTALVLTSVGTTYPLLAVRKGANYIDRMIQALSFTGNVTSTNDMMILRLHLNPTLSAPMTYSALDNSGMEFAVESGTVTKTISSPGSVISVMPAYTNTVTPPNQLEQSYLAILGSTIAKASDELVLSGTPVTATVSALAFLNLKEY